MIQLKAMAKVLTELNIEHVDLLKINIEGGEFPLLEYLLNKGLMARIKHLQVQFHDFTEDAVSRRELIRKKLAITHAQEWCYPFVWESWRRH